MRRSVIKSSPFTTFVSSFSTSSGGGRGGGGFISPNNILPKKQDPQHPPPPPPPPSPPPPVIGFGAVGRGRGRGISIGLQPPGPIGKPPGGPPLPSDPIGKPIIFSTLDGGAGRGKVPNPSDKPRVENRHIRAPKPQDSGENPRRGGGGGAQGMRGGGGGAQGMRGRGRGRGLGRGRGRGRGEGGSRRPSDDDDYATGLYLGEPGDGEKLAKRLGADVMNQLAEGFEDMANRVLPSPLDDAYEDALRTNFMIECEPEWLMPDFTTNPDIDDTPPMSLEEALQKMKPFLMAYENIKTHEEWEEAIEETMKSVPLLKQIVDTYGGPDVVTAMQQQQELERVVKAIPQSGPASIRRFANNAVLSLQSNPGWGFDKKCQLMDKLVQEVSQQYK